MNFQQNKTLQINEVSQGDKHHHFSGKIKQIINKKIDVAYVKLDKKTYDQLEKYKVGIFPVRVEHRDRESPEYGDRYWVMAIVYNDVSKALKLYQIAKRNNGYLTDRTPEEAREIGEILGYTTEQIENHIRTKFGNKNTIQEQNFPEFEKGIENDIQLGGLEKKLLLNLGEVKVYAVNADFVRDKDPGLNFNGFTDGGSHYVTSLPGYKKWIPENEIWVDDVFLSKPNDLGAIVLHELIERHLMKYYGVPYDTAHADFAEKAESQFRKEVKSGFNLNGIERIYNEFAKKYSEHHRMKHLKDNYQLNKTKDLLGKVNHIG